MRRVLITGGAGFIGSHVADELLRAGDSVRVLDSLVDQVHGASRRPAYLDPEVDLQVGDVRDPDAVARGLTGVDAVVHLAARVGVGQSMYEIAGYASANTVGTGVLLEALVRRPIERLVAASSMSVYGEGLYVTDDGQAVSAARRKEQLERREWEPKGPSGESLEPAPTPESKQPDLSSVYALTKYDQEQLALLFGNAYGVPVVALRLFNVYGPRQALSNPYTGALAIFASRLLNGRPPLVYEDGAQRRDFVSVHDVATAFRLALDSKRPSGRALNVGSGRSVSVLEAAELLSHRMTGGAIRPQVTGTGRVGDVRHCFADIALARELLHFEPRVMLEDGLAELAEWLPSQSAEDRFQAAADELAARGLAV